MTAAVSPPSPAGLGSVRCCGALVAALGALLALPPAQGAWAQASTAPAVEIVGPGRLSEGALHQWSVFMPRRHVSEGPEGYTPVGLAAPGGGDPLPTTWERPVAFHWDFGDGTRVVTGERATAGHRYEDDGVFTITVRAVETGGREVVGQKAVTVTNRPPRRVELFAVEIEPAESLFELSAESSDVAGDPLTIEWDFGDGEKVTGPLEERWRVRHAFPLPGRYPVTVKVEDGDGATREAITHVVSTGGSAAEETSVDALEDDGSTTRNTVSRFDATISGSFAASLTGEVRSLAGLHLSPVDGGRRCRFLLTAWDPTHLASVAVILDLPGLPAGKGARYTFRPGRVDLNLDPTAERYAFTRRGLHQAFAGSPLAERIVPGVDERLGLDPAPPAAAPPAGDPRPAPAVSSFGLEDHEGFRASGGTLELTFVPHDRATARFDLTLTNLDRKSPYPGLSFQGSFALDLAAARRDGLMNYDGCAPARLEVEEVRPEPGTRHSDGENQWVTARFSGDIDPATLNEETFQLTWPDSSGALVPVEAQVHRRGSQALLVPTRPLRGGVRHTARVKTGPAGVRSRGGAALEDADRSGWYAWDFTTRVDVVPGPGAGGNLSCHVFQTVRDAPLVAGKPAVARIYADWTEHPDVDPGAQVRDFTARVVLREVVGTTSREVASELHRFVRPTLHDSFGVSRRKAEHTANVFFTPESSTPSSLVVGLEVPQAPSGSHAEAYQTRCATPMWEHAPTLKVRYYLLAVNEWTGEESRARFLPVAADILAEAERWAEQLFPFRSVRFEYGGALSIPPGVKTIPVYHEPGDPPPPPICDVACATEVLRLETARAPADVVIGLMPAQGAYKGGGAVTRIGDARAPAVVRLTLDDVPEHRDRWVFAVVHEIAHTLGLEHLPYLGRAQEDAGYERDVLQALRDHSWANAGKPVHWYEGIEGFRIERDGRRGYNKSSVEGNAEGSWLVPLMFPTSMLYRDAFIVRHQYFDLLERIGAWKGAASAAAAP